MLGVISFNFVSHSLGYFGSTIHPLLKKEVTNMTDTYFKGYPKVSRAESDSNTPQTCFNHLFLEELDVFSLH